MVESRASVDVLPLHDIAMLVICPLVKLVSGSSSPPSKGRRQMFDTPPLVSTHKSACRTPLRENAAPLLRHQLAVEPAAIAPVKSASRLI